jgi:hypothetical protein
MIMNKTIILAGLLAATTASAGVSINGTYKGTLTEGSGATYAQDLDLTLVGSVDENTSVTVKMEDLTGGSTLTANQVFVETAIEGLRFKGGNYKNKNGAGLLQVESAAVSQFEVSTDISGIGVTVKQVSGDGNATVNIGSNIAGIEVAIQNAANDARYVTAAASIAGLNVNVETQDTGTGVNTGVSVGASGTILDVTGVFIDVNDGAGITQDDGILGDISDATTDITGIVVSTGIGLGTLTGKYIDKNDTTTYVGELERGIITYRYTKADNADGAFSANLDISF